MNKRQAKNIFQIFFIGWMILIGAIGINIFGNYVGLVSWYEFLLGEKKGSFLNYIWLFFLYPFLLGAIVNAFYQHKKKKL